MCMRKTEPKVISHGMVYDFFLAKWGMLFETFISALSLYLMGMSQHLTCGKCNFY